MSVTFHGPELGHMMPLSWYAFSERTNPWGSCRLRSYWFAALDDERVVVVGAPDPVGEEGAPWLGPTFVDPEYRGQGIQSELIRLRLALAKRLGLPQVDSATDVTNTTSLRNMLNAGFKVTKYNPEYEHIDLTWSNKA